MHTMEQNFAANLRRFRKKTGFTQKALADLMGYSEKAVSKWESGTVLPPTAALLRLSDALQVSLDELLWCSEEPSFFLGIDGGATETELVLTDGEGNVLRRNFYGSCNPVDIGMKAAQKTLEAGIRETCRGIPLRKVSMYAGISGGISGDNRNIFHDFFASFRFAKYDNGSDAQLIVAAGLGGSDGIAVIMGTGSVAFVQKQGQLHRIGGLGYLFDNGGNGYCIGRDVLRAAMTAEDGMGQPTLLSNLVAQKTGNASAIACLADLYTLGKRGIAAYAPLAFEAARQDDAVAQEILQRNMEQIAALLTAGRKKLGTDRVKAVFVGGLTQQEAVLMPMIRSQLQECGDYDLSVYRGSPVNGALLLAGLKKEVKQSC